MQSLSSDTRPEAQRKHYEMMRSVPDWKRLALAFELTQATRLLILANLEYRFPEAGEGEIRRRFITRTLPREEVIRAFGFDPLEEGY